ncbi:MAG TPA: response regulator [Gammaproteobacteria bacterium]|nr:response regulator [Gammaproteobacteria bacterium]
MEAMQLVRTQRPAVVLMDIRMPGMDRLEASRHLAQMDEPPAIIFTTTCSEHGLEAFDSHAGSYLVKPIRQERLEQALNKARRLTQAQLAALSMEAVHKAVVISAPTYAATWN